MRELKLFEIHKIQLEILKDVTDFCEANGIDYFISCGTLLGSVRHQGFIPWDHDIDITMPRDSYEKFLSAYRTTNNYVLVYANSHKRVNYSFVKVIFDNTTSSTKVNTAIPNGVNIDIFPMDSFVSEQELHHIFRKIKPLKETILQHKHVMNKKPKKVGILNLLANISLLNLFIKIMDRWVKIHHGKEGDFMAVLIAPTRKYPEIFKRDDIFPTKRTGIFEGLTFRIPNDPDRYLSSLYGDYMKLPPIDEIKSIGRRAIYWKD